MAAVSICYVAGYCGGQQPWPSTSSEQIVHCYSTSFALPVSKFSDDAVRAANSRNRRKGYSRCSANDSIPNTSCDNVKPENDQAV